MTRRQAECLEFLKTYQRRHGQPPTYREIALGLHVCSKGTVTKMVNQLLRQGKITRKTRQPRGLRILFNR